MKRELTTLARYRFARAKESFQDGVGLLENDSLNSAVNRFYYAAFYAARGLLTIKGLDSQKHSGIISMFGQHFVKTGVVAPEVAKALRRSFEKRLDTDYEDFVSIEKDEVEQIQQDVRRFINVCERVLVTFVGEWRSGKRHKNAQQFLDDLDRL